jgi:predicted enzyme related to lactoylglutathione lyase
MAGAAGSTLTRSGTFVWEELITSDVAGAREFYGTLFGWTFDDAQMPGGDEYVMFGPADTRIGGLYTKDDMPTGWITYVGVDSSDDAASRASELGATVLMGPFDVPEAGRMAVVKDPSGGVIQTWQPLGDEGSAPPPVHGTVAWRELRTPDATAAGAFYAGWLGWKPVANDMGDFTYTVFHKGDEGVAGMMEMTGERAGIPAHWAITFNVDDVDAAYDTALAAGATTQMPPDDLPDVGRFAALVDPQGNHFGIMRWAPQLS